MIRFFTAHIKIMLNLLFSNLLGMKKKILYKNKEIHQRKEHRSIFLMLSYSRKKSKVAFWCSSSPVALQYFFFYIISI